MVYRIDVYAGKLKARGGIRMRDYNTSLPMCQREFGPGTEYGR